MQVHSSGGGVGSGVGGSFRQNLPASPPSPIFFGQLQTFKVIAFLDLTPHTCTHFVHLTEMSLHTSQMHDEGIDVL